MARKYKNVQGTNDFLIAAIGLTLLGLWAVRDAWFPTPKVLEKHPLTFEVMFEDSGRIDEIMVQQGMMVSSNSPIARVSTENLDKIQEQAETELDEIETEILHLRARSTAEDARSQQIEARLAEKEEELKEVKRNIAGIKQNRLRHIVRSDYKGRVQDLKVDLEDQVEAGNVAAVIDVKDHFYTFNKSLAIGSLLGALICAIIHIKLK